MRHEGNHIPPKFANRLLELFCSEDLVGPIQGDLQEFYVMNRSQGMSKFKADFYFFIGVLSVFRPFAIKKTRLFKLNFWTMLRHTLLMSFRSIKRYKHSFFINLIGLSSGLTCAILIYLWVSHEISYDKFHEYEDRLFQVMMHYPSPEGLETIEYTPGPLSKALTEEFPEVEYAVSVVPFNGNDQGILSAGDQKFKGKEQYVGNDYFKIFSYRLIEGDKDHVLDEPDAVAVSEELAIKLFGDSKNVIGKEVKWQNQFTKQGAGKSFFYNRCF